MGIREDNLKNIMDFMVQYTNKFGIRCIDLANAIDNKFSRWPEWISVSDDYDYIINEVPSSHWRSKYVWYNNDETEAEIIARYNKQRINIIDKRNKIKFRRVTELDDLFKNPIMDSSKIVKVHQFNINVSELDTVPQYFGRHTSDLSELLTILKFVKSTTYIHVSYDNEQCRLSGEYTITIYPISRTKRKTTKNKNAALLIKDLSIPSPMALAGKAFGYSVDNFNSYNSSLDMRMHTTSYAHEDFKQLSNIVNSVANDPDKLKKFNSLRNLGKASFANLIKMYYLETLTENNFKSLIRDLIYTCSAKYTMNDVNDAIEILKKKHESYLASQKKKGK